MTTLRAGAATADITPTWSLTLAGFAARTEPSRGVAQPLRVRVVVLESREREDASPIRVAIVAADLLWWGPQHLPALRRQVAAVTGADEGAILFSATHTHSGPQTSTRAASGIGVVDERYLTLLEERTVAAAREAVAALTPVTVHRREGSHDLGFNRRPQFDPHGPVDPTLTAIRFDRPDGSPAALLVHSTCHPVITQEPLVSGEWPGVAMEALEGTFGAPALFLQGCCGDINPVNPDTGGSLRGGDAVVAREGNRFAHAVAALLREPGTPLAPAPLAVRNVVVDLPFASLPDDAALRGGEDAPGVHGEWCRALLAHPEWRLPSIPLRLQRLDLAQGLGLLAMDGEIVVAYGLHIRQRSGGAVLPLGYANGMTGYIPTAKIIAEGGYEGGEAIPWFLLPAPFDPAVEAVLTAAIDDLLAGNSRS